MCLKLPYGMVEGHKIEYAEILSIIVRQSPIKIFEIKTPYYAQGVFSAQLPVIIWVKLYNPFNTIFVSKHTCVCAPRAVAYGTLYFSAC
jgi:hypothetical protein